jgi:hypothetical protein
MPWQERWELRTKLFGCNCSTTTFLAAFITCISTLVSLLVLWLLWKLLRALWLSVRAPRGGWRIDAVDDVDGEHWKQGIWVRRGPGLWGRVKNGGRRFGRFFTKGNSKEDGENPEVLIVDERRPLLG